MPDDEEPTPTQMLATCRTPDCPVQDQTFEVGMYPNASPPTWRAQCGQCGNPITDIEPAPTGQGQ
ncbi:hypothetical protein [Streptomyces parvus]|uniref:hypothetical protein n=1 Tax=Streptomyces parvus TaxID=66428 RepID=UPI0035E36CEA